MDTENTMNTSETVDKTEDVNFEEVKEERAIREAADNWLRYITYHLDSIEQLDQLGKDLGAISIQEQERKEKSDDN